jgi:hypothetical protein
LNKPDDELPVFNPEQPKPPDRTAEASVNKALEHDERVGRALYDRLWIGDTVKKEEWEIGRAKRADQPPTASFQVRFPTVTIALPSSGKEAATIARAHFRYRASNEQTAQVMRWLNDLGILDASVSEFDAWFLREFPDVSTQKRKDAVRDAVKSGLRPPLLGGTTPWKKFFNHVREQSGQHCDDRTIMRDVEELKSSGL